jgi:hypothetical protein
MTRPLNQIPAHDRPREKLLAIVFDQARYAAWRRG